MTYIPDAKELDMNERSHQQTQSDQTPDLPAPRGSDGLRMLLWSALVVSAVGNTIASAAAASIAIHVALGAVSAVSVVGLAVTWMKARA